MLRPRPTRQRLTTRQLIAVVTAGALGLMLVGACVVFFLIAAAPWGPCDPGVPACGPARGRLVGAGFVSAVLGVLVIAVLTSWLVRRDRPPGDGSP